MRAGIVEHNGKKYPIDWDDIPVSKPNPKALRQAIQESFLRQLWRVVGMKVGR